MELSKEQMEALIRKYQEEALRYQQKSTNDLYREEIPAQEVNAQSAEIPSEEMPPREELIPEELTEMPRAEVPPSPTGAADTPLGTYTEDGLSGVGDILYSPEPLPLDEVIKDSQFSPSTVPYDDSGRLQLEVTTGEQSLPVPFANAVVVREVEGEQELVHYLQTDISGSTPVVELPAPARGLSEQPEPAGLIPYGVYTVAVSQTDYYTTIVKDVQIFAGQPAILPVSMIPLSEKAVNPSAPNRSIVTDNHSLTE